MTDILVNIQHELKAPKNQRNSFGGYNYRSCEDILEAVKPILFKYGVAVVIEDEIVAVGNRVYVRATAKLKNGQDIIAHSIAYAREPETKKGMDEAQITGATSSYARKYALNGLFAIDDTKDADTMDNREETKQVKSVTPEEAQEYYQSYLDALESADDIDTINTIVADARKNLKSMGWSKAQQEGFATAINKRKIELEV